MPDLERFSRIRQGLSAVMQHAGETAVWRQYVSASAALAQYGLGSANTYVSRTITGLFAPLRPQEVMQPGGFYQAGDLRCTCFEPISTRDEFLFEGSRYQAITTPVTVSLFGSAAHTTILRRA